MTWKMCRNFFLLTSFLLNIHLIEFVDFHNKISTISCHLRFFLLDFFFVWIFLFFFNNIRYYHYWIEYYIYHSMKCVIIYETQYMCKEPICHYIAKPKKKSIKMNRITQFKKKKKLKRYHLKNQNSKKYWLSA